MPRAELEIKLQSDTKTSLIIRLEMVYAAEEERQCIVLHRPAKKLSNQHGSSSSLFTDRRMSHSWQGITTFFILSYQTACSMHRSMVQCWNSDTIQCVQWYWKIHSSNLTRAFSFTFNFIFTKHLQSFASKNIIVGVFCLFHFN